MEEWDQVGLDLGGRDQRGEGSEALDDTFCLVWGEPVSRDNKSIVKEKREPIKNSINLYPHCKTKKIVKNIQKI
jgi:hypothetical protein